MSNSQTRAVQNYRSRLNAQGRTRFEALGRRDDRDLIRFVARRLAEKGPEASQLRSVVSQTITGAPPKKGGILAALRRSPLAGTDLDLSQTRDWAKVKAGHPTRKVPLLGLPAGARGLAGPIPLSEQEAAMNARVRDAPPADPGKPAEPQRA